MGSLAIGAVQPVRRTGLRDEVYQSLLDMLIDNRLPEGTALRVESLANLLEVSHTPVREALVRLESTGLVQHSANRGYRVSELPGPEEFAQIMDARAVLEIAVARRAASRPDRSFVAALTELIDTQEAIARQLAEPGPIPASELVRSYLTVDHAFHDAIFRAAANPVLERLTRSLDAQSQRARQVFRLGISDAAETLAEHRAMIAAIEHGDPDEAEAASRAHLDRVLALALRNEAS